MAMMYQPLAVNAREMAVMPEVEEKKKPARKDDGDQSGDFKCTYYAAYFFAILMLGLGIFLLLAPQSWRRQTKVVERISVGSGLIVCGIFLLTNADLVITYIRLKYEIGRFKENNKRFELSLKRMDEEVGKLQKTATAFKEIDKQFGGQVGKAVQAVDQLRAAISDKLAMCVKRLVRLYTEKDRDGLIDKGEEFDTTLAMMASVFSAVIPHYGEREEALKEAMCNHPKFKASQGVKVQIFSDAMECACTEADPSTIDEQVIEMMDEQESD
mmetsp:Transcript_9465/g.20976  ORF Transcript_9465/g.20976 Transcript_9465/m.20976 type:complete len:270 (+) Transcript_9465:83-892(+)